VFSFDTLFVLSFVFTQPCLGIYTAGKLTLDMQVDLPCHSYSHVALIFGGSHLTKMATSTSTLGLESSLSLVSQENSLHTTDNHKYIALPHSNIVLDPLTAGSTTHQSFMLGTIRTRLTCCTNLKLPLLNNSACP
jgi:hypothetical protein